MLRMISDIFDATNDASLARSVYLALTEIASDEQSDRFTKSINEIAKRASVSYRTTFEMLKRFEGLRIIAVQRNIVPGTKELAPSTYTLCTGCRTLCTGLNHGSVPRYKKESNKTLKKNVVEEPAREGAVTAPATTTAAFLELEKIAQRCGDDSERLCAALQPYFPTNDVRRELSSCTKWYERHGKRTTPRSFVRWLLRCEPELKPPPRKSAGKNGAKPQPPGWEAWLTSRYPDARIRDFWKIPYDSVRNEFREFESSQKSPPA